MSAGGEVQDPEVLTEPAGGRKVAPVMLSEPSATIRLARTFPSSCWWRVRAEVGAGR